MLFVRSFLWHTKVFTTLVTLSVLAVLASRLIKCSFGVFCSLEDVAATLDSRAQSILEVESDKLMEPLLTALGSKLLRQEGMVRRLQSQLQSWTWNNLKSAEAFATLMEKTERVKMKFVQNIHVSKAIGSEGWTGQPFGGE